MGLLGLGHAPEGSGRRLHLREVRLDVAAVLPLLPAGFPEAAGRLIVLLLVGLQLGDVGLRDVGGLVDDVRLTRHTQALLRA
jgi:hypothetical protein